MGEHDQPGHEGRPGGPPQQPQYPGGYGQHSGPGWGAHPPFGQPPGPAATPGPHGYPTAPTPGGPQGPASGFAAARPRTRFAFLIGAFVGLVLGGGGVALGWLASTAGQPEANAACAAVARTATFDPANDVAGYYRWGAASAMALAAAEAEPQYQALYDAINRPLDVFTYTFSTEAPEFLDAVAKARQACDR
jgi:hypothetical protein